jgi:hypothetical protein
MNRLNYFLILVQPNSHSKQSTSTPRKGREMERTRSRPNIKLKIPKSPKCTEDEERKPSIEESAHNLISDLCSERLKIGKSLLNTKCNKEIYKKEFIEKIEQIFKLVYQYFNKAEDEVISILSLDKEIKILSEEIKAKVLNNRVEYLHLSLKLIQEYVSRYILHFKDLITEIT